MKLKPTRIMVAALLSLGLADTVSASQQVNFYQCSGRGVNLTLSIGGNAEIGISPAATILTLELGKQRYSFEGRNITVESTLIGELWEVMLQQIPDSHIEQASVVIPEIRLGNEPLRFASQLILTRVETPLSGEPAQGVINASKYVDLSCTASMVY